MMLVERGELDLDTDVNQYLDDVRIPQTFEEPVTLNHLMTHRAGFEDTFAVFTHADADGTSISDGLNRDTPARVFAPGARTSHSNWGSTLAAKIVADVSGVPYERFLHEEILTPLGMTETTIEAPAVMSPNLLERLAVGYELKVGTHEPAELSQIGPHAPAGGIASTTADMARWMLVHLGRGQLDETRLMSRETHEMMWTRAFPDRPSGADLAHGFFTKPYYGYVTYSHGGATAAFYTYMLLVPELDLGVFVSQNDTEDRGLCAELPDLIVQRLAAADRGPGKTTTDESLAGTAAEYAGSFLHNRRSFTRFEKLFATGAVAAGDDGSLIVRSQGESVRYEPFAGVDDIFQDQFGNRIVFGRDEAGRVGYYTDAWGVDSLERIGARDSPNSIILVIGLVVLFSVTNWLGVLWRRGVPPRQTSTGKLLGVADCAVTIVFLALVGTAIWAVTVLSSATAADFVHYPPTAVTVFRVIAFVFLFIGVAAVVSLWPAWRWSGWGVWRRIHHTLFALSLAAMSLLLVQWNVVFASTAV